MKLINLYEVEVFNKHIKAEDLTELQYANKYTDIAEYFSDLQFLKTKAFNKESTFFSFLEETHYILSEQELIQLNHSGVGYKINLVVTKDLDSL